MGETLVAKELTRLGRKNGVGKVKWDAGKVSKIIKRKNYLGYTVYCQSYSNNYLEQKRIKRDESEFVYVKVASLRLSRRNSTSGVTPFVAVGPNG